MSQFAAPDNLHMQGANLNQFSHPQMDGHGDFEKNSAGGLYTSPFSKCFCSNFQHFSLSHKTISYAGYKNLVYKLLWLLILEKVW